MIHLYLDCCRLPLMLLDPDRADELPPSFALLAGVPASVLPKGTMQQEQSERACEQGHHQKSQESDVIQTFDAEPLWNTLEHNAQCPGCIAALGDQAAILSGWDSRSLRKGLGSCLQF